MNRKIYHIEFKKAIENKKHFYYGDLTILCNTHKNIGISKYTLDRRNFETHFENEICIIRKSFILLSTRSKQLKSNYTGVTIKVEEISLTNPLI